MKLWRDGRTLDISRTGVLFRTDEEIPLQSVLDIRVDLPQFMKLSFQGAVVRSEQCALAVQFHRFSLEANL